MRGPVDRLEAMSVLIATVETGSFSAASRKLAMPLPTVSRKVSDLEAHLGTRLLVRTTRSLTLTDNGAAYLSACKRILDELGDAERKVAGEYLTPRGELVITAPVVFGRLHVLPIVNDFLAKFPDINIRLLLADRNTHLVDDQIDLAVRVGDLPDSSMVATKIGAISRVVCASPKLLAAQGTPKTPAELGDRPCITFDSLAVGTSWNFASPEGRGETLVAVRPRLSVNTAEAAIDAAIAGLGFTQVLSYQVSKAVETSKLKIVLRKFERTAVPISIIHTGQTMLPLKTRSFLEFAAPRLRRAIGG